MEHSEKNRMITSRGTNGGCFEEEVLEEEEDGATKAAARAATAS